MLLTLNWTGKKKIFEEEEGGEAKATQKRGDLLVEHHIHGSKPTKSHKKPTRDKILGRAILVGIFEIGNKKAKIG